MSYRTDSASHHESPDRPNGASQVIPGLWKNAIDAHQSGRLDEAKKIYLQILAIDVRDADALHLLGLAEHQAGHSAVAEKMIRRAIAIKTNEAIYRSNLGLVLQAQGRAREAVAEYRLALKIRPEFVEAYNNLGNALGELGQLDEAISSYNRALDLRPDYAEACSNLGKALFSQGKLEDARAWIERALSLRPGNAETCSALGAVLRALGKPAEARIFLEQAIALNPNNAEAYNNLSSVLREQDDFAGAKACLVRAIELKPDYAVAHNNLGSVLREEGNLADARICLDKALALQPDYAEALCNLARILRDEGHLEESRSCLQRSIKLKPDNAEALCDLGVVLFELGDAEAAQIQLEQALALKPDLAEAHYNLGSVHKELGRFGTATALMEQALAIKPDYAKAKLGLSLVDLLRGDYAKGWRTYETRWQSEDHVTPWRAYPQPHWKGEKLASGRLLLWGEQGVGDEIQFAGLIPDAIRSGNSILLDCAERLKPLFARSFPEIEVISGHGPGHATGAGIAAHLPTGSLPLLYRTSEAAFASTTSPYLKADPVATERFRNAYGNAHPLVGLAWRTMSPKFGRKRSIQLSALAPLFAIPDFRWISLQYGDFAALEEQAAAAQAPVRIDRTVDQLASIDLFAAQVAAMDLVVTIDNSTAHLAGALGVPVWLLLPTAPDWRWQLGREDSLWYPTMRLFRQAAPGDWQPVVARIADDLTRTAGNIRAASLLPRSCSSASMETGFPDR
jgi:tetratricopeptide (TPR) repeat protein